MSLQLIKGRGSRCTDYTRALLAKIHIGKAELDLPEDTYRDLIAAVSKGRSTTTAHLDNDELEEVLDQYRRWGWHGRKGNDERVATRGKAFRRDIEIRARMIWEADEGNWKERLNGLCKRLAGVPTYKWVRTTEQAVPVLAALNNIYRRKCAREAQE